MSTYILPFEKMHGLGNDFIILEHRNLPNGVDEQKLAKILCNRNLGIGADGIIIVDFSTNRESDFTWRYYNCDGSEAQMCGNGMRCFAKYVFERGFTDNASFTVLTKAGIITPKIEEDGEVTVNMGRPKLPDQIKQNITIDLKTYTYTYIEVGNPHCVIFLDYEIGEQEFYKYGPAIEKHSNFPFGVNVEFSRIINNKLINCRVWERGCVPTLACGTGACAVLLAASINGFVDNNAVIQLPGGDLNIFWDKDSNNVFLKGPATFIYTGQYNLDPAHVYKSLV